MGLVCLVVSMSVVFGGASRDHELRLAAVELSALPLLVLSIAIWGYRINLREHRFALSIVACLAALPLIQLVPLPYSIWSRLPGRELAMQVFSVASIAPGWLPVSIAPDQTWHSFLALIPPISIFIAIVAAGSNVARTTVIVLTAFATASSILGLAQLGSGGEKLYPWATTSAGSVTGFFANRNHLATMCLVTLPFLSIFAVAPLTSKTANRFYSWLGVLGIILIIGTLITIRSRAGLVLAVPTLTLSLFAALRASGRRNGRPALLIAALGIAVALGGLLYASIGPVIDRFDQTVESEGRFERWPGIQDLAEANLPLGTGVGSFDTVYRSVEPIGLLGPRFFNQAHNDYLEIWLEAGWLGIGLIIAFAVWLVKRTATAWGRSPTSEGDFKRAASIGILVVLAQSAVDYPIRTTTIAVMFALCCGIMERNAYDFQKIKTRRKSAKSDECVSD